MAFTPVDYIASYFGWNQFTPALPNFYWDVYSAEERVKKICFELDKLCNYANMLADNINIDHTLIDELQKAIGNIENIDELQEIAAQIEALLENIPDYSEFEDLQETVEENTRAIARKAPNPLSSGNPVYGTAGQVLTTQGNGTTTWENPVVVDETTAAEIITDWLDAHPEATTTVVDGSISIPKFANDSKDAIVQFGASGNIYGLFDVEKSTGFQIYNLFDPNDEDIISNGYLSRTNQFTESLQIGMSGYVHAIPNLKYKVEAMPAAGYALCYDKDKNFIGAVDRTLDVDLNAYVFIPIINTYYMRFLINIVGDNLNKNVITCNKIKFIDLAGYINKLDAISRAVVTSPNLLDKDAPDFLVGEYYNANGVLTENSNFNQSGLIPVYQNTKYTSNITNMFVVWFDADKNFMSSTNSYVFNTQGYVIPPLFASYARFLADVRTPAYAQWQVVQGMTVPEYSPYGAGGFVNKNAETESPFYGLSCVAFGTSLTYRAQTTGGYLQYLDPMTGMTTDNQGIGSGYILALEGEENLDILNRIKTYSDYASKDVCLLEGFVNDWFHNKPLGTFEDTDEDTVCGCVRSAITHILSQNANIALFLILDHYGQGANRPEVENRSYLTQYEYYDEIAKVATSLSVPVVYEYRYGKINQFTPQYLLDNIHCSALGAKQSAQTIYGIMKLHGPNLTD